MSNSATGIHQWDEIGNGWKCAKCQRYTNNEEENTTCMGAPKPPDQVEACKSCGGNSCDRCPTCGHLGFSLGKPPREGFPKSPGFISANRRVGLHGGPPSVPIPHLRGSESGGLRYNKDKPRHSLISPWAMEGLAAVLTKGAVKYSAHNWRQGLSWTETIDSLKRHLIEFEKGEVFDPETGLPHIDLLMCNAMFLSEFQKLSRGTDDRWTPPEEEP